MILKGCLSSLRRKPKKISETESNKWGVYPQRPLEKKPQQHQVSLVIRQGQGNLPVTKSHTTQATTLSSAALPTTTVPPLSPPTIGAPPTAAPSAHPARMAPARRSPRRTQVCRRAAQSFSPCLGPHFTGPHLSPHPRERAARGAAARTQQTTAPCSHRFTKTPRSTKTIKLH